jgi:hypothetical protein
MLIERVQDDATEIYRKVFDRWVLLDVEQDYQWREGEPYWCVPGRYSVNFIAWRGGISTPSGKQRSRGGTRRRMRNVTWLITTRGPAARGTA